ncbi:hypothetical protein BX600DRAFT_12884 [Xylariales sp. PMI_506]|nr:hypothetical protein BX600DRAFT_12884 [Xylariales sp. PMI_506]
MNLQLNDPGLPGPGELQEQSAGGISHGAASPQPLSGSPLLVAGDQRRSRAPSLGELHQELEAEQEAQVNRLLQMIRQQQVQLQQLQASQGQNPTSLAAEDMTPISERSSSALPASGSLPPSQPLQTASATSTPRSPVISHPRSSFDANRDLRPSRTSSHQTPSPRLRSTSISGESAEPFLLGGRDESAFYQAETQSLVRENQMLRHRIRELERQLNEAHSASSVTHEPSQSSLLLQSTSASEEDGGEVFRRNPSNDNPKDD